MLTGESYVCECCGGTLRVEIPCTCEQTQSLICTCGEPMKVRTPSVVSY